METLEDVLLTPEQVAGILKVGVSTLAKWRCKEAKPANGRPRRKPPLAYIRRFGRIRYRRTDVLDFIDRGVQGGDASAPAAPSPRRSRSRKAS
jgi:Helix-turn-helix domain